MSRIINMILNHRMGIEDVLILFLLLLTTVLTVRTAKNRGRNPWLWGAYGLLFPLISLIHASSLKPKYQEEEDKNEEPKRPIK